MHKLFILAAAALAATPALAVPAEAPPMPVSALKAVAWHFCAKPLPDMSHPTLPADARKLMNERDHETLRAMCAMYWQGRLDSDRISVGLAPTNQRDLGGQ